MSKPAPSSPYAGLVAALFYSIFSITITLFNKSLLTSYKFDSTLTLTLLQGLVTVGCLEFMKWRGWVSFPSFNFKTAMQVLPLSIVFVLYVVVSLISLGRVNVPMFTALRRLTILFVMVEEYFYFGTVPSMPIVNSVIVMTVGAAIAAWKDFTFDLVSYTWLFFTNLFTSLYTVYINVIKKKTSLNVFGMLYYNTITTLPALALLAWATGDLERAWSFRASRDFLFQVNYQASVVLAFLMNVSTFYCTTLNSARTMTVVGQLKNVVPFVLGLILFDDYIYDHINFLGLLVGFWGGIQYSWVTYRDKADTSPPPSLPQSSQEPAQQIADAQQQQLQQAGATAVAVSSGGGGGSASEAASSSTKLHAAADVEAGSAAPTADGSLRGRHAGPAAAAAAVALNAGDPSQAAHQSRDR